MSTVASLVPRFESGRLLTTPAALDAIRAAGQNPLVFIARHLRGNWGDVSDDDKRANEIALRMGERLVSAYTTALDTRFYVITEADRSATTILLSEEY